MQHKVKQFFPLFSDFNFELTQCTNYKDINYFLEHVFKFNLFPLTITECNVVTYQRGRQHIDLSFSHNLDWSKMG